MVLGELAAGLIALGVGVAAASLLAWKIGEQRVRNPLEAGCWCLLGIIPGVVFWSVSVNPSDLTIHPDLLAQLNADKRLMEEEDSRQSNKKSYVVSAIGSGYGAVAYKAVDDPLTNGVRWHGHTVGATDKASDTCV
eukprot:gb/GEZN01017928.1/.p1 GENE.gb/GEZN01017928.1/~~gb/GEZN01017928.1/.p1  ORF type:complete len:136 (+),score=10.64 gb/GEZN01017928.1/:117-524(+)